ncbi:unnamed protein product [Closterium sp. Naga37s-1]|nr:unnamed protein product [Closterium sp. Naga37s-1]
MPSSDREAEASRLVPSPPDDPSEESSFAGGRPSAHEPADEPADEAADAMEDGSSLLRSDGDSAGSAGGGRGGGASSSSSSSALPASSSRARRPMQVERHDDLEPRSRLSSLIDAAKRNRLSFAAVAAAAVVLLGWMLSALLAGLLSPPASDSSGSGVSAVAAAWGEEEGVLRAADEGAGSAGGRCAVYTFFDLNSVQGKLEDEEKLVTSWQLSWQRAGWAPQVLQKKHAGRHPLFPNLQQRAKAGNWEFMRWLAMAVSGGGLYAHYSVINLGLPPPPRCFQSALTAFGDSSTPSLVSGSPHNFVALARSSLLPSGADLAAARGLPVPRGIVQVGQSTARSLLVPGRLKKRPWQQATSLLCSTFAQTTEFQAVSLPSLGGMQSALEDLKHWIRLCTTHTTPLLLSDHVPSHLLPSSTPSSSASSSASSASSAPLSPSPSPSRSLTYFLLPHHASLYFAADYEKYHIDPTTGAPQWMRDSYGAGNVPTGLTYSEFLIILTNALMGKNPDKDSDPHLDDRLSRGLASVLHVGMEEVAEEPHLSIPVLELSLGFLLEDQARGELEEAIGRVWEGVGHFVGAVHGEAKEEMERHSRVDERVLAVVDGRFRQAVSVAQALDV